MTTEKLTQKMNSQLGRLFRLNDPLVSIIMVLPRHLSNDIIAYYSKLMELGRVTDFKQRCTFVVVNLPAYLRKLPLIDQFYYDSKAVRSVMKSIQSSKAYLVTGYPSSTEYKLAY